MPFFRNVLLEYRFIDMLSLIIVPNGLGIAEGGVISTELH